MGRPIIEVTTLHGYTIEELIDLQNSSESKYTRIVLKVIIMRSEGHSNDEIIKSTGLSKVSIVSHVKNWNRFGLESIKEHRGGKRPRKLSLDIVYDLIYVILNKSPYDFQFTSLTWTCELLALYVKQNYDIEVSYVTIWSILKDNNLFYKRSQSTHIEVNKKKQETFILNTLKSSCNASVYELDKNDIWVELNNCSNWIPVGL